MINWWNKRSVSRILHIMTPIKPFLLWSCLLPFFIDLRSILIILFCSDSFMWKIIRGCEKKVFRSWHLIRKISIIIMTLIDQLYSICEKPGFGPLHFRPGPASNANYLLGGSVLKDLPLSKNLMEVAERKTQSRRREHGIIFFGFILAIPQLSLYCMDVLLLDDKTLWVSVYR